MSERKKCSTCGKDIVGKGVSVEGGCYHPDCFCCDRCKAPLTGRFHKKDGQRLCEGCNPSVYCEVCRKRIEGKETRAEGKAFHPECFRCGKCGDLITGSFFRVNGELRCSACQRDPGGHSGAAGEAPKKDLPSCRGCKQSIREDEACIVADKRDRFHDRCFICRECGEALTSYVILEPRKYQFQECPYYCESCADKLEAKEAPEGGTAGSKPCAVCGGPCGDKGSDDDAFQLMDGCVLHWRCFRCSRCNRAEEVPQEGRMQAATLLRTKVGALLQGTYVCAACTKSEAPAMKVRDGYEKRPAPTFEPVPLPNTPAPTVDVTPAAPVAPTAPAAPAGGSFLTLEELKDPAVWKACGVDASSREQMLSDADFQSAFGSTKEEFQRLPAWKRTQKKKDLGLF